MIAALDDLAVFQHENRVGIAHGRQAVGNNEHRPSVHQAVEAALDELLRAGIDGGGRLVENQHRRLGNRRPRDGQQLPLALREVRAVGIEQGVVALRQVGDEIVRVGDLGGADAVLVRRVELAVADVLHHRAGEQMRVLQNDAERAAQIVLADVAHVDAVVGDLSGLNVVEAVDEVRDGRLARAGRADKGDLLAGLGVQRKLLEHRLFRHVGKVHVVEPHVAAQRDTFAAGLDPEVVAAVLLQRDLALVHLRRHIQHGEDALRARQRQHNGVELLGDLAHAVGKVADVVQKRDQHTARAVLMQPQNAHCAGQRVENVGEVIENRADDGRGGRCGRGGAAVALVDRLKVLHDLFFMGKDLDIALTGDHFFEVAVDVGGIFLLLAVAAAADLRNGAHDGDDDARQRHHERKEPQRQHQHHGDRAEQGRDGDQHLRDRVLQQLVRRLDVVGEVAHQAAVGILVKIADGQLLHLAEQLRAQFLHDDRAAFEHQAVEQVIRNGAQQIQRRKADQQRNVFCIGFVRRKAGFLQQIHQRLHAVGRSDGRARVDQNRCNGADQNRLAVLEIAEQAHQAAERRLRLAIVAKLYSRHLHPPPVASGCRKRRGRSGCAA